MLNYYHNLRNSLTSNYITSILLFMKNGALDRIEWMETLDRISLSLRNQPTNLTLIGSGAAILSGQPSRTSMDLDVWKPTSRFSRAALRQACEDAGILFDPKGEDTGDTPYIQVVEPGIVQVGEFDENDIETVEDFDDLQISRPPVENIIASKLLRATPKDLEDIAYLISAHEPEIATIHAIVETFPAGKRSIARENLIYLEVLGYDQGSQHKQRPRARACRP